MKQIAIDKAAARLERARTKLAGVAASRNYTEFESAWSEFLISLNAVPVILEKGARENPRSRQWFFSLKSNELRKDQLLVYLSQARNTDEHGLDPVSEHDPGGVGVKASKGPIIINASGNASGWSGNFQTPDGEVVVNVQPPRPVLKHAIDDRYGDVYPPPEEHLGKPLMDKTPHAIGLLGLSYYEGLIEAARAKVA